MRKMLFLITIFICFLTSCTGIDSRKIEKILENNDCLYNDEYGIELNSLYPPDFSDGYINDNDIKISVLVFWNYPINEFRMYNKESINSDVDSKSEYFDYVDSELSDNNIIMLGRILYEESSIVLKIIESSITVDFDEIILEAK